MVNSGSLDSDGDRSDKFSVTQSQSARDASHSSNPVTGSVADTCKTALSQTADSDQPSAIEPTLTKTAALDGSMSVKNCLKNRATYEPVISPAKDELVWLVAEKSSVYCSLPLEKVKGVLTPYQPSETKAGEKGDVKVKQQSPPRKLLCLYCERTFVCANLRHKHVERCHSAKQNRRVSARRQNQLTVTPCIYCDRLNTSEHTLNDLFIHLVKEHSDKYFGCLSCEDRFLNLSILNDHNASIHLVNSKSKNAAEPETPVPAAGLCEIEETVAEADVQDKNEELPSKVTRSKKLKNSDPPISEDKNDDSQNQVEAQQSNIRNPAKLRDMRNKRLTVKTSRIALKRSKRLQAQAKEIESQKKKRDKRLGSTNKLRVNDSTKLNERDEKPINPYPEFDHFYRVKKITDHSIDNLKINSLTFDDVFDKAFFNRIKCNIEENLLNFIDGKLFKNEESETRISNFEKISGISQEVQNSNSESYGCELSLNAVTPVASLSLNSQFGEDFESQIEYGSRPSKKKSQTKRDEVHYKYFTRRKFQASILEHKENRDLSKLDMWTQLVIKKRQQKILDEQKSAKEILEYTSSEEYKSKLRREELNRVLDRRGPFEDLKEEATKMAALEKLNSSSDINISEETFTEVREVLNFMLNKVFELTSVNYIETVSPVAKQSDQREVPWYLNLRLASSFPSDGEIDKSDHISLICSSQETENFELPTNTVRGKDEMIELTGEWARCRMYICAACGDKLPNMKYLLDHKTMYHQNVWTQHYELVGNQSELYRHLSIPGLGKVGVIEDTSPCKFWKRSDARTCAKCGKQCNSLGELHRHILECGEDWTWMLARKKCKYRPFGAKSRRKRRGLIRRIHPRQKTDPSEKKLYKKTIDGPRQRPSDADTIQRMLANLPAKRSRRNIISLQDALSRRKRKVANKPDRKPGKSLRQKQNVGKRITNNTHIQREISSKRRSLRSLNKVLSSRILDTNASLMVKRKLKAFSERRLTRRAFLAEKIGNPKSEADIVPEGTLTSETSSAKVLKKYKKNSEIVNETTKITPEVSKRSSPRISKNGTRSISNKKVLGNTLNIKSFFPVKKKKNIKTPVIKPTEINTEVKLEESKTKRKSKENREEQANINENVDVADQITDKKVIQNLVKVFNRRHSRRKKPQIVVETKNDVNTVEEKEKKPEKMFSKLFQRISRNNSFSTATERVSNKIKKDSVASNPKTRSKPNDKDSQRTVRQNGQRMLKNDNKKRKLTRNFRSVIDKVKKLKLSSNVDLPNKIIKVTPAPTSKKELPLPSGIFLEKENAEKENPLQLDRVVVPLERKENTADSVGPVLIVVNYADFKENPPIPETIFNLESNNEKQLQAKGELDFDKSVYLSVDQKVGCEEETVLKNKEAISKTGPINIDVSPKPKNVPLVSPNLKGKIKKPSRGLNDCIAMLTSKLQQKEQLSPIIDKVNPVPIESQVQPSKKLPNITKQECILRIPTFKVSTYQEETALDLSKKSPNNSNPSHDVPCASQTLVNTIDKVIEDVIENKCKEVFTETVKNNWNSVDITIQEVIDEHEGYEKINEPLKLKEKNSLDETIEFVVNNILSTPNEKKEIYVPLKNKKTGLLKQQISKKRNSQSKKKDSKNDTQLIPDDKSTNIECSGEIKEPELSQENSLLINSLNSIFNKIAPVVVNNEETNERDSIIKEVIQSSKLTNEPENVNSQQLSVLKDMIALSNLIKENASQHSDEHISIIEDVIDSTSSKFDQTNIIQCEPRSISNAVLCDDDLEDNVVISLKVKEIDPKKEKVIKNGCLNTKRKPVGRRKKKIQKKAVKNMDTKGENYNVTLTNPTTLITEEPVPSEILNISVLGQTDDIKEQKTVKHGDSSSTENDSQLLVPEIVDSEKKTIHSDSEDELPLAVLVKQDDVKIQDEKLNTSVCENDMERLFGTDAITETNAKVSELVPVANVTCSEIYSQDDNQDTLSQTCKYSNFDTDMKDRKRVENIPEKQVHGNLSENDLKHIEDYADRFNSEITSNDKSNQLKFDCVIEHEESKHVESDITENRIIKEVSSVKVKTKKLKRGKKGRFSRRTKRRNPKTTLSSNEIDNTQVLETLSDTLTSSANKSSTEIKTVEISPSAEYTVKVLKDPNTNNSFDPQTTSTSTPMTGKDCTEQSEVRVGTPNVICNATESTILNTTEDYISNKQGITKQRTRRKSKSFKKIGKVANDLFKDFALVINKKTKRIPPTSIVDDSVCDENVTDRPSTLPKLEEKSWPAAINNACPEESTEKRIIDSIIIDNRDLDDSIEEMDMELEEIAVNSTIIERNNVNNENSSFLIDSVATAEDQITHCIELPTKNKLKTVKKRRAVKRGSRTIFHKQKPMRRSARNQCLPGAHDKAVVVVEPKIIRITRNNSGKICSELSTEVLKPNVQNLNNDGTDSEMPKALEGPTLLVNEEETPEESIEQPENHDVDLKPSESLISDVSLTILARNLKSKAKAQSLKLSQEIIVPEQQADTKILTTSNISETPTTAVTNSSKIPVASEGIPAIELPFVFPPTIKRKKPRGKFSKSSQDHIVSEQHDSTCNTTDLLGTLVTNSNDLPIASDKLLESVSSTVCPATCISRKKSKEKSQSSKSLQENIVSEPLKTFVTSSNQWPTASAPIISPRKKSKGRSKFLKSCQENIDEQQNAPKINISEPSTEVVTDSNELPISSEQLAAPYIASSPITVRRKLSRGRSQSLQSSPKNIVPEQHDTTNTSILNALEPSKTCKTNSNELPVASELQDIEIPSIITKRKKSPAKSQYSKSLSKEKVSEQYHATEISNLNISDQSKTLVVTDCSELPVNYVMPKTEPPTISPTTITTRKKTREKSQSSKSLSQENTVPEQHDATNSCITSEPTIVTNPNQLLIALDNLTEIDSSTITPPIGTKRKSRGKAQYLNSSQENIGPVLHDATNISTCSTSELLPTNSNELPIASDNLSEIDLSLSLNATATRKKLREKSQPSKSSQENINSEQHDATKKKIDNPSETSTHLNDFNELPILSDVFLDIESSIISASASITSKQDQPERVITDEQNLTDLLNTGNPKEDILGPSQINIKRKQRRPAKKRKGKNWKRPRNKTATSKGPDRLEVLDGSLSTLLNLTNKGVSTIDISNRDNLELNTSSTENIPLRDAPSKIEKVKMSQEISIDRIEEKVPLLNNSIIRPDLIIDSTVAENISKTFSLNANTFNGSFGLSHKEAPVSSQSLQNTVDIFTPPISNSTSQIFELRDKSSFKEPHAVNSIDHSLEIEALKSVLGSIKAIKRSSKKRGCKLSQHILPEIEPLTHILNSSDIDIAPVIDEIDKSLEIDDIYDFNDFESTGVDQVNKRKTRTKTRRKAKHISHENRTRIDSKSKELPDPSAVPELPLEMKAADVMEASAFKLKETSEKGSTRTFSIRTAKIKALENIHDEALFEFSDVKTITPNSISESKKKLQKLKKKKNQKDNSEIINNLIADINAPVKEDLLQIAKSIDTTQINEILPKDFVLSKNGETAIKSVGATNIENLGISDKKPDHSMFSDIYQLSATKLSEIVKENIGKEETVNENNSGQELRRSRRVLPKVASYNENDLIDPLIDALEKKRRSMKKDKPAEKPEETSENSLSAVIASKSKSSETAEKMTSDELFDLLKISSNENDNNIFMLKTQNSFLNNLDESNSTRDFNDFDNVFENILEKSTLLIRSSSLIAEKDTNNVYEFTVSSPESTEVIKSDVTDTHADLKDSICEAEEFSIPLGSTINSSLEGILSIPPTPTPDTKDISTLDNKSSKSKETKNEQTEKNYCDICNKYFIRVENLVKHRRTLTHISKLSEIEAKEAAEKSKQEGKAEVEIRNEISTSSLRTVDSLRDEINITDILQQSEQLKVHTPQVQTPFENNHTLKLADIINDVLNKPVLDGIQSEKISNFSEMILQNAVDSQPEVRRCKSLGERKSFESDKRVAQNSDNVPNNNNYFSESESKTTILEKQISLLENIIENQAGPLNSLVDEISLSNSPKPQNSRSPAVKVNCSKQSKKDKDGKFLKPTPQYEEISEDSTNLRNYEDQKLRKTLNRDEELFLECCSLLKSSSEISSFSKKSKALRNTVLKQMDEPEWLENKSLVQTVEEAHEFSDNSRTPTPLGDTFDDDASNSNTISSNWEMKKGKEFEIGKRKSFSFEEEKSVIESDLESKNEGANFGEILSSTLKSQFNAVAKNVESKSAGENIVSPVTKIISKEDSDSSVSECKKIITKGARKVFEGLKVSIPTEVLDLKGVLKFAANSKHLEQTVADSTLTENKTEADETVSTPIKPPRKSRPIKNSQVGSNVLFKKSKKWNSSKSIDNKESKEGRDVYDFEETQDNADIFTKPDFKTFRSKKVSDCENKVCTEPSNIEGQSTSSISSVSVKSLQTNNPPENVTKKKCMIMGRIFKNAAKSKVDEIDEEIRAIPEIDNMEFVENYVLSCAEHVKNNQEELSIQPKMSEKEMNILFDQLLGKPPNTEAKVKANLKTKPTDIKKKVKGKNRKRARANSVSDDEFNINKTTRKRTSKKQAKEDNCINLEQELRECIGVASRKSQRKCTSGKQNVLVEYWSSDEEAFEALLESKKIPTPPDEEKAFTDSIEPNNEIVTTPSEQQKTPNLSVVLGKEIEKELLGGKAANKKSGIQRTKAKNCKLSNSETVKSGVNSNRRKRAAAHPLYHWSSSSEDESHNLIEIKPIREDEPDDDEDRPVQHGWIVGDSPKKLVTMLALTKGKKSDADCVKEQGKKRTNAGS